MAVLPTGIGPVTGYQISRSVRLRSSNSAYFNRTQTAGNQSTWTWSGWVKLGNMSGLQYLFHAGASSGSGIAYNISTSEFQVEIGNGTTQYFARTSGAFRDPSAWYHVVGVADTNNATSTSRLRLYVNGVLQVIGTSSYPTSGFTGTVNQNSTGVSLGRWNAANYYFDGYLTEINFIDGQALTPSSFGETDTNTGVWKPKAYTGTYGTNGFFLKFADNSGTTSTTLGKDSSSNGNNWTPNNFSVTAGAGNDSLVDSPTSYGTDTGVGGTVRGNYCIINQLNKGSGTVSDGNLSEVIPAASGTAGKGAGGTIAASSGKWYAEFVATANSNYAVGVMGMDNTTQDIFTSGVGYYALNGQKYVSGTNTSYGATYTTNDVIGVALDIDGGTVTFYKNNTSQGAITLPSLPSGGWRFHVSNGTSLNTQTYVANFGQRAFAYTAPSGFKALCTTNLPTPTIGATSTTQANDYFNAVLYTGNGSTQTITGLDFQPDWTWIKERSSTSDNLVQDAVRGVTKLLETNTSNAEQTATNIITSFNSNGFSLGVSNAANENTQTYVAWNWKANGAGSSNTAGSITSTVSVNTTSGFSIVTYTGASAASSTVGHGLGVAPSMIIVKDRSRAATNWPVYHKNANASPANGSLLLNSTLAFATTATPWSNTAPTSSVFTISNTSDGYSTGINGDTFVAYCFAEVAGYSAFGSYTGNGSADGPFVFTNFRPRYVMFKRTNASGNSWILLDTSRNTYNAVDAFLSADTSNAETTSYPVDFLSNGFKMRATTSNLNTNGGTYIYMALAESPFKFSLAR
jgi:hypothetical protein